MQQKPAILFITFGSTLQEQKSFLTLEQETQKQFPNATIHWAFTSTMIRKILHKRGVEINSPEEALKELQDANVPAIYVQSVHTAAGAEYTKLTQVISSFAKKTTTSVTLGKPLLYNYHDLMQTKEALLSIVPAERKESEGVIFMGHGNGDHPSDYAYIALHSLLQKEDTRVFMGTVEGFPTFLEILQECQKQKITKVWLLPFLFIAGKHAYDDMAGEKESSWYSQLKKEGIECEVICKGTGEYVEFVDLWLNHLTESMSG